MLKNFEQNKYYLFIYSLEHVAIDNWFEIIKQNT